MLHWEDQSLTGDKEVGKNIDQAWVFQFFTHSTDSKPVLLNSLPSPFHYTIGSSCSQALKWVITFCLHRLLQWDRAVLPPKCLFYGVHQVGIPWFQWRTWKHWKETACSLIFLSTTIWRVLISSTKMVTRSFLHSGYASKVQNQSPVVYRKGQWGNLTLWWILEPEGAWETLMD